MSSAKIARMFSEACASHLEGRVEEAEKRYLAVLRADQKHADALHNLSLIRIQQGKPDEAAKLLRRALIYNPRLADAHNTLGSVLASLARPAEAVAAYDRAIALKPDLTGAWFNRGHALAEMHRHEEALASYRRVLELQPGTVLAHQNSGFVLKELGRIEEAEESYFAGREANADPYVHLNARADRLLVQGHTEEAAAFLEQAMPAFASALKEPARRREGKEAIARVVLHTGHHLLRRASAEEISTICGLPVDLLNLDTTPAIEYAAANTLVIYASDMNFKGVLNIKNACPDCVVAAWHFDNHHFYLWNALLAAVADLSFPAHVTSVDYLSRWAAAGRTGALIPLAVTQWPSAILAQLYRDCRDEKRTDELSGTFLFYENAHRRNRLVAEAMTGWPEAGIGFGSNAFHERTPRERFLSWRQHKTSAALPVHQDLPIRFFDALAAGQVPIVPRDVLGFDHVIPPEVQSSLPVIRLEDYTVQALKDAHAAAVFAFDRGGEEQAEFRHRYVLEQHMLAHRIRDILCESRLLLGTAMDIERSPG